ncbi:MAG: response regulator [Polyangiales bacterium]
MRSATGCPDSGGTEVAAPVHVNPTVLLLDDDDDLRAAMSEFFAMAGCECFPACSVEEMQHLPPRSLDSAVALLDINLGPERPSGLDAFRWLQEKHFRGQVVFLTGHAKSHRLVDEARRLGSVRVMEKPMPLDELLSLVERAEEAHP